MADDEGLGPVERLPFPDDVESEFSIFDIKKSSVEDMEQELLAQIQKFQRARRELMDLRDNAWTELKERLAEEHPELEKKIFSSCHIKIAEELGVRKGIEIYTPKSCPLCRQDVEEDKKMAAQGIRPNKVNINLVEKGSDDSAGVASGDIFDMMEKQLLEKYERKAEEPSEPEGDPPIPDGEGWEETIPDGM